MTAKMDEQMTEKIEKKKKYEQESDQTWKMQKKKTKKRE